MALTLRSASFCADFELLTDFDRGLALEEELFLLLDEVLADVFEANFHLEINIHYILCIIHEKQYHIWFAP